MQWISKTSRLPEKADADQQNCVLAWHVYNGVMITGYHQIEKNRFISHWMKPPAEPECAEKVLEEWNEYLKARYGYDIDGKKV